MKFVLKVSFLLVALGAGLVFWAAPASGQRDSSSTTGDSTAGDSSSEEGDAGKVIITREALQLIDPKAYRVALSLEPIRELKVAAPVDGVVLNVIAETGKKLAAQEEVLRLDNTEQQLLQNRAEANLKAAQIELRRAQGGNDSDLTALAEAKLEAAQADLNLAQYRLERTQVRTPFAATAFRIEAVEGQVVNAGDVLLTLGDTTQLKVEIPVDRNAASAGGTIELSVEDKTVTGRVQHVLPLAERFEPIREILHSVASAVVVIENPSDLFKVGQTVHVPLVPQDPITVVSTGTVANTAEGRRRVQVIRDNIVRDIVVELLGPAGTDRTYVSGPFSENDELVVSSSRELADGTQIRATTVAGTASREGRDEARRGQAKPARTGPGF